MTYRIVKCYDRLSGAFAGYLSTHGNNVTVVSDVKDATPFNWYHYGSDLYLTKNSSPARYLGEAGGKRADWGLWAGDYCEPVIYNADSSVSLASAPGRRLRLPSGDDRVFWSDDDTATDILQIDLGHPRAWLSNVPGTTLIGDINLPGTHDSAAIDKIVTSYSCHYRTITQQLEAGVRLLDVRLMIDTTVHPSGPPTYTFMTCHGNIGQGRRAHVFQTFPSLLVECRDFLAAYPSEFIAMSLKIDDQNAVPDADMPAVLTALDAVLANELIAPSWPTAMLPLDTMRGKIYLLDRIVPALLDPNRQPPLSSSVAAQVATHGYGVPLGIDDNTPGQLMPADHRRAFEIYVQDKYEKLADTPPVAYIVKYNLFIDALPHKPAGGLLINFASGTWALSGVYIQVPVIEYIAQHRPATLGWSLFDYEETSTSTDLGPINAVEAIIASNFGYPS